MREMKEASTLGTMAGEEADMKVRGKWGAVVKIGVAGRVGVIRQDRRRSFVDMILVEG